MPGVNCLTYGVLVAQRQLEYRAQNAAFRSEECFISRSLKTLVSPSYRSSHDTEHAKSS